MTKRIGILTSGSDCPGLNAAIRAVGKTGQKSFGMEVIGFQDGFQGLVEDRTISLEGEVLSGILTAGGTILGTSRDQPHETFQPTGVIDLTDQAVATYHKHSLDGLVCIGGHETQESALRLMQKGLNILTLPKSIENNVVLNDQSIGFNTALEIAAESIDRLHSTAHAHHRIMIVEVMSRTTGWLALGAGLAGGADVILIPEIPYDMEKVVGAIAQRNRAGKRFSIIVVAERTISLEQAAFFERMRKVAANTHDGPDLNKVNTQLERIEGQHSDTTFHVANQLKNLTGLDTRITILGYLLRGGAPAATDRILATRLGTACAALANEGRFGAMVGMHAGKIEAFPLEEVAGKNNLVSLGHPWIESARKVGTSLGD